MSIEYSEFRREASAKQNLGSQRRVSQNSNLLSENGHKSYISRTRFPFNCQPKENL